MARILIAEDDPQIAAALEKGLSANGFTTVLADNGEKAQSLSLTDAFDLLILDMGLPEREGFHVLQELRSRGKTLPVLVLTGRSERDVVACLEAGADDYMRKPFDFDELVARLRIRLRSERKTAVHNVLTAGGVKLDLRSRNATVGSHTVALTTREFALLEMLAPPRRSDPEPPAAALSRVGAVVRSLVERRRRRHQLAAEEARPGHRRDRSRGGLPLTDSVARRGSAILIFA